jgi:hypothetical protein
MGPPGGSEFLGGGSPKIYWATSRKFLNNIMESSAQAQSVGTLLSKLGGSVDKSKSLRHTPSGAGRRVSQANSLQTSRIVPA